MGHSRKLGAILDAADRRIDEGAGIEHDEFWQDNLPQMGDPVFWGWGSGPAYWPTVPAQPGRPARPATLPARGTR